MFVRVCARILLFGGVSVFCAYGSAALPQEIAEEAPAASPMTATAQERIDLALDRAIDLDFVETPLAEVAEFIAEQANAQVVISRDAIEEAGLSDELPVTKRLTQVKLRHALEWILDDLDLTFVVRDEAIEITTPDEAQKSYMPKAYPVREIAALPEDPEVLDHDSLIEAVTTAVAPNTWEDVGGAGAIGALGEMLIVTQSEAAQRKIAALLAAMGELKKKYAEAGDAPVVEPIELATSQPTASLLAKVKGERVEVDFLEAPLAEVVAFLSEMTHLKFELDIRGLEDSGLGADVPVTFQASDALLSHVLTRMLRELDLTWVCDRERVLITTPERAALRPTIKLYPVRDLATSEGEMQAPAMALRGSLPGFVEGETWSDYGGAGSVVAVPVLDALVVAQSDEVHAKIEEFLASLRQAQRTAGVAPRAPVAAPGELQIKVYRPLAGELGGAVAGELMPIVRQFVEPQSWSGQGSMEVLSGALVVRHTADAHRQIRKLFRTIGLPVTTEGSYSSAPLGMAGAAGGMGGGGLGGGGGMGGGMGGGGGFFKVESRDD
jgi:hypothetical protein